MENVVAAEQVAVTNENKYSEGAYRFWLQKSGSLALKLDGGIELYTIPKGSKLYDRLIEDLFEAKEKTDNDYALGYYRFWLSVSKQLSVKLDRKIGLYTIPKKTPLYDRLMSDLFTEA